MPTNVNLKQIIINSIPTKELYDRMKVQGLLEPNQLYLVEEDPSVADMSKLIYDANGVVADAGGIVEYVAANGGKIDVIKRNGTALPIADKEVDISVPTKLSELSADSTHRVVTDTEKSTWNGKGTYSKPSGGIPKSDLASGVQESLNKADSALQSFTETDPTVPDWAKQPNKPSYIASEVGADPSGTAAAAVLEHNADANAHEELFADCLKASDEEPSTPASVNADTLENHPASYFQPTIAANGILKGNGTGGISAAVAGTDFAPAGYGVGTRGRPLSNTDDLNEISACGFYFWTNPAPQNAPFTYGTMIVTGRDISINGVCVQEVICLLPVQSAYPNANCKVRRNNYGGTYGAWEWVNPPTAVGVEYRTTERFRGKPVYVKLVDCGVSASGETKTTAHGISNLDYVVETICYLNKEAMPWLGSGSSGLQGTWNAYGFVNGANIAIWTGTSLANKPISARLKYTKTTD